ncbi:MAG: class I SAM-dependent methyltransferase [Rhodothermaceae bacterium]|nr:class I SAM-dependent methyltransferase [Rhodothermaceae bacterium]
MTGCEAESPSQQVPESDYELRASDAPDGTGKFYLGREIAGGADLPVLLDWLERPTRATEELPDRVIQALELEPTDVIADIGAGTGYFAFRISPSVPGGKVFAVDIQQEMIDVINQRINDEGTENIEPVLGTIEDPNLPAESVDVAIIILSYHEFSHPKEMMEKIVESLKPGGRLLLVEYRGEDSTLPISPLRRMTEDQSIKEMRLVGLRWVETKDILPQQHFMIFEKG